MDKAARAYRSGLALVAVTVLAIATAFTYRDISGDLVATRQANARLTAALAASIEAHFDAALRDAANAALSAAVRVEQGGGPERFGGELRLHDELQHELSDTRSTARLVLTDGAGRVLASSLEYPVAPLVIRPPARLWPVARPGGRIFEIGVPERSVFDGRLVIPYLCDVLDANGRGVGKLRAEVRVEHFRQVYLSTTEPNHGTVLVLTDDGVVLLQLPLAEQHLGLPAARLQRAVAATNAAGGEAELAAWPDDVPRFYSWRKIGDLPVTVAVGLSRETVLQPWRERAQRRAAFAVLASLGVMALVSALAVYVRHLSASRRQLREAESKYWVAMENSTVGIALMTVDGRMLHANPALCKMLGYTEPELLAMRIDLITVEEDRAVRSEVMAAFAQGRLNTFEREKRFTRKDGGVIWVHAQSTVMRDERGQPTNFIVHLKDVTQRKEAERSLRELNESLEQRVAERTAELSRANKDLEAFSYSAAHDLRGPLGRLTLFVDALHRDLGEAGPKVAKRLDSIQRQVRDMETLIESLLTLARASRTALHRQAVDLAALVPAVIADVQHEAQGRAIAWKLGALHALRADRALLREALVNLLGNAVKYTRGRDPAVIEVSSEVVEHGAEVVVRIADNGAGFDMSYAADLFAPFRRLHAPAEFEGTGVGLAIVERIIERNGGRIWAHGEPGKGATFWFALPAA
jgi:PAS domain S-box-containing protein